MSENLCEEYIGMITPNLKEKFSWTAYLKDLGHDAKAFKKLDSHAYKYFEKAYKQSADASEFEQNYLSDLERDIGKIKISEADDSFDGSDYSDYDYHYRKSQLARADKIWSKDGIVHTVVYDKWNSDGKKGKSFSKGQKAQFKKYVDDFNSFDVK